MKKCFTHTLLVSLSAYAISIMIGPSQVLAATTLDCSPEQNAEVFRQTTESLDLSCLPVFAGANNHITRPIVIAGDRLNSATIDCAGGSIGDGDARVFTIRSSTDLVPAVNQYGHFEHIFSDIEFLKTSQWKLPQNITIKNCQINGGVRIYGAGRNGQAETVKLSSHHLDHTARLRAIAPRDIFFENIEFSVSGSTSVYISPGVHHIQIQNSIFRGITDRMAIYLDAESAYNRFINNTFDLESVGRRELISVDGSSDNVFERNIFQNLSKGGIYVYRNCGESGVVRHNTPERNLFRNNVFDGANSAPFMWFGSRAGRSSFCPLDAGFAFGSSIDDMDYADNNTFDENIVENAQLIRDNGSRNIITNTLSQRKDNILYGYLMPQATPPKKPTISHGGPAYIPSTPDTSGFTDAEEVIPYNPPVVTPTVTLPVTPVVLAPQESEREDEAESVEEKPIPEMIASPVLFDGKQAGSTWNYGTAQNPIYGSMGMPTVFVWSWNYGTTDAPVYYNSSGYVGDSSGSYSAKNTDLASGYSYSDEGDIIGTPSSGLVDIIVEIFKR